MSSPFRIAVINDEVSQDFGKSCEVISREFGLEWIELRAHVEQKYSQSRCQGS